MANYQVVDADQLEADLTGIADAIREKTEDTEKLSMAAMAQTIRAMPGLITAEAAGGSIVLTDATDLKLRGLTLYGKTTQDGTPTPEVPVPLVSAGDGGSVGVTVAGKNLLKYPYAETTKTTNGITFTDNGDGTITVNGTATGSCFFRLETTDMPLDIPVGLIVTLSGCPSGGSASTYRLQMNNGGGGAGDYGEGKTLTIANGSVYTYIQIFSGFTANDLVFKPQLEIGSTATAYEPYKESQTLTLSTPNGLPGIPVDSGGNYTDEMGQQWICDEVDLARGVYVQRVFKTILDGSERWTTTGTNTGDKVMRITPEPAAKPATTNDRIISTGIVSTAFSVVPAGMEGLYSAVEGIGVNTSGELGIYWERYNTADVAPWKAYLVSNPITVIYELETPTVTPLSAEELAAYALLHTHYPNTTILNDGGAGMAVKYAADTKLYIDQKFDQLAAALVNN